MKPLLLGALASFLATSALIAAYWQLFLRPYDRGMDGFDLTETAPADDEDEVYEEEGAEPETEPVADEGVDEVGEESEPPADELDESASEGDQGDEEPADDERGGSL